MIIYKLKTGNDYFDWISEKTTLDDSASKKFDSFFEGKPWEEVPSGGPEYRRYIQRKRSDFPCIHGRQFIISKQAYNLLKKRYPNVLQAVPVPVENPDTDYYRVDFIDNPPLDPESSELKRFKSSGRVMRIKKYGFSKEFLHGKVLFRGKFESELLNDVLVTDEFVTFYLKTGLTGLSFVPIISTEGEDFLLVEEPLNGYVLNERYLLDIIPRLKEKYSKYTFLFDLSTAFLFLCHTEAESALQPFETMSQEEFNQIIRGINQIGDFEGLDKLKDGAEVLFSLNNETRELLSKLGYGYGGMTELEDDGEEIFESDPRYNKISSETIDHYIKGACLINEFSDVMDKDYRIRFADFMESIIDKIKATGILDEPVDR